MTIPTASRRASTPRHLRRRAPAPHTSSSPGAELVRLLGGVPSAGGAPSRAVRELLRCCEGYDVTAVDVVAAGIVHGDLAQVREVLGACMKAGLVAPAASDFDGWDEPAWVLTTAGRVAAGESLMRPLRARTAQLLLRGVLVRAAEYNRMPGALWSVASLSVCAEVVNPGAGTVAGLPVVVGLVERSPDGSGPGLRTTYGARSGRVFPTVGAELSWALDELTGSLRAGSGYVSVHLEVPAHLPDRQWVDVFTAAAG